MDLGDWVGAAEEVVEENFMGEARFVHARKNAVGHVISLTSDPEWVDVFWERTGTITVCHLPELIRLGGPDTGKRTA